LRRPQAIRFGEFLFRYREVTLLIAGLCLGAYFQFTTGKLLSTADLLNLSQIMAPIALLACPTVLLIASGEIDLSIGQTFALAPFLVHFAHQAGIPLLLADVLAIGAVSAVGFINGMVTVYLGVPSFVTTLGTFFGVNGLTLIISNGEPVDTPGTGLYATIFGHSWSLIIWAVAALALFHFVLKHMRWGLYCVAIGGNYEASREAGINVDRIKIGNFIILAAVSGFAGILAAVTFNITDPLAGGSAIMFSAISAVVIGGTALAGGFGTVIGAFIGAGVLALLQGGLSLQGVSANAFDLILGIAILSVMILNVTLSRQLLGRRRA
jgi:simple sugar transport system permease protein